MVYLTKAKIKIYRDDCEVTNEIYEKGLRFKHLKVKPGIDESVHIIKFEKPIEKETLKGFKNVFELNEYTILVTAKSCSACKLMSLVNLLILSAEPDSNNSITYTVLAKSNQLNEAIEKFKESGLRVEIISKERPKNTDLSQKQIRAVLTAYKMGYFCKDRKATLTEVANSLNVKPSSLEDVLRKGLEKILTSYFLDQGLIDEDDVEIYWC
ncbi:helix-turn-helix domain-containing protein [Caldisphaera lagunensis]|uniref:helix-turn-helix domain-containing protein n=1 Tax=Caldisphaera lagunensis TaxID=200415 RepID=UPI000662A49C|nr:helix-turn-helix domain-containing protein [Caldisphaera lagunensis]